MAGVEEMAAEAGKRRAAVQRVTEKRVADRRQVCSNLMTAGTVGAHLDAGSDFVRLASQDLRPSRLSAQSFGLARVPTHTNLSRVPWVAGDRGIDDFGSVHDSSAPSDVPLFDLTRPKLVTE